MCRSFFRLICYPLLFWEHTSFLFALSINHTLKKVIHQVRSLNSRYFTCKWVIFSFYATLFDIKLFSTRKYPFNNSTISHREDSISLHIVLIKKTFIFHKLSSLPKISALTTSFSFDKSTFEFITIFEWFIALSLRDIIKPFSSVCILFIFQ